MWQYFKIGYHFYRNIVCYGVDSSSFFFSEKISQKGARIVLRLTREGKEKVNGAALILTFWFSSKAKNKKMELEREGR
jgi:hypothetical protein